MDAGIVLLLAMYGVGVALVALIVWVYYQGGSIEYWKRQQNDRPRG
jgi:hypothetical protein